MRTILVVNPKGGCGKTTIATNLSGYYANKGISVSLVDLDKQRSSFVWCKTRPKSAPKIESLDKSQEFHTTKRTIFDCPAQIPLDMTAELINRSDVIVMPINPSIIDQRAAFQFIFNVRDMIRAEKCKLIRIGLVANRSNTNVKSYGELESFADLMKTPIITSLRNSQNYVNAAEKGLTIFDLPKSLVVKDKKQWRPLIYWAEGKVLKNKAS